MFHQVEGLHIDKNINMGHLKGCLNYIIKDVFSLLKDKYYIEQCILEIDELFISKNMNYHLLEFCKSGGTTIYISTKDPNYTLNKNIH